MGLNEFYIQARSHILLMSYVPGINQAYAMLISNKCQRSATSSSTSMGMNSISSIGVDPLAMYSRIGGSYTGQSSNKFKKKLWYCL